MPFGSHVSGPSSSVLMLPWRQCECDRCCCWCRHRRCRCRWPYAFRDPNQWLEQSAHAAAVLKSERVDCRLGGHPSRTNMTATQNEMFHFHSLRICNRVYYSQPAAGTIVALPTMVDAQQMRCRKCGAILNSYIMPIYATLICNNTTAHYTLTHILHMLSGK